MNTEARAGSWSTVRPPGVGSEGTHYIFTCGEWKRKYNPRWGRKIALVLSCTLVGAVGTLKAFAVSYEMYLSIEFLETLAGASTFPTAYVYTVELLGRSGRAIAAAFLAAMLVVGGLLFALLAKTFHYWRTFILVAYPPSLLFFTYAFLLPESVRWLLSKGRRREAADIVKSAARFNRVTLSDELLYQLEAESPKTVETSDVQGKDETCDTSSGGAAVLEALRSRILVRRLVICSWWWISCTFVFYGLAINSVSLAGDKYANYMLVVSVELVAVAANALLLDRAGRRRTLLGAFALCGAACTSIAFVPAELPWVVTLLYLVGKIGITMAFGGVYMYTSELFPTSARHSLLGACSMVGRLGSIVAPQTPLLAAYAEWLPAALFGGAAVLSALLMLSTPETLNVALPDTIRDAEMLGAAPEPVHHPKTSPILLTLFKSEMRLDQIRSEGVAGGAPRAVRGAGLTLERA
ncbi:Organic cation transporter protein [Eumeta japonica]|uniref:Organic cation transporter protein n=1 Tax=Eumeta variegata TaxID=151549 RepID=A0A4C1WRK3_EUMVA|nr:Organic cation transporter protein [Eumeta japonica]